MSKYLNLIDTLSKGGDAMYHIITPLTPYILCDYYMADEIFSNPSENFSNSSLRGLSRIVLTTENAKNVKEYDKLFIQTDKLAYFVNYILPMINVKFILFTGKCFLPQIFGSDMTENLLKDDRVVLWFSQNPIYKSRDKYRAFAYGVCIWNNYIYDYAKALLNQHKTRNNTLGFLNVSTNTHPCRKYLTDGLKFNSTYEYFREMSNYKFIISPIGDRDDCHRHWESIGMGAIPISNVGDTYKQLFGKNMLYINGDSDFLSLINTNGAQLEDLYDEPNRDLITVEYWRDLVESEISKVRNI